MGAIGAADAGAGVGAGVGAGRGAGGPSPLIAVQPPTKLYFRQTPETPEPLNKYIYIYIYILRCQYHVGGQKTLFTWGELRKVRYTKNAVYFPKF